MPEGSIGYLRIAGFAGYAGVAFTKESRALHGALDAIVHGPQKVKGLVIDARLNSSRYDGLGVSPVAPRLIVRSNWKPLKGDISMKRIPLTALLVVVLAPAAFADQVTLKNGDRLTGSIITSDAKALVLKTEYADAVTIKWDFVQQVQSAQPLYVGTKGGQVIVGPVTTSDSKLAVSAKESGSVPVAKDDVTYLRNPDEEKKAEAALERPRHPGLADLRTSSLDTGLGLVAGNSKSNNFAFGLNAVRATTRDKVTYYTTSAFSRSTVKGATATTA